MITISLSDKMICGPGSLLEHLHSISCMLLTPLQFFKNMSGCNDNQGIFSSIMPDN